MVILLVTNMNIQQNCPAGIAVLSDENTLCTVQCWQLAGKPNVFGVDGAKHSPTYFLLMPDPQVLKGLTSIKGS